MSGLLPEAANALERWRQINPAEPVPPVAVYLRDRDRPVYLTGLAVAPSQDGRSFAISGLGYAFPIFVVRDEDVERVEIGGAEPSGIGFTGPS